MLFNDGSRRRERKEARKEVVAALRCKPSCVGRIDPAKGMGFAGCPDPVANSSRQPSRFSSKPLSRFHLGNRRDSRSSLRRESIPATVAITSQPPRRQIWREEQPVGEKSSKVSELVRAPVESYGLVGDSRGRRAPDVGDGLVGAVGR
ncbi:hypothetical protein TIFTF001_027312 [Ficus carica]|uniref:Uncharacterized protein n=1 Tax=Ficus carica TaxID=3494 RepID=A0AA88DMR4_FICCA|nr:hypothetical protein TIFTF001_027312 [Ficus carica]